MKIGPTEEKQVVYGFKGFNRDMTCRGLKFEEWKTYQHDGVAK